MILTDRKPDYISKTAFRAIQVILEPIARFIVHFRIPMRSVVDSLESLVVQAAMQEYSRDGKPPTDIEIQMLTGIGRKKVPKVRRYEIDQVYRIGSLSKVIGIWTANNRYRDPDGAPKELPIRAVKGPSFSQLVKEVDEQLSAQSVLDRFVEDGAVEVTDYDHVRLISSSTDMTKDVEVAINAGATSLAWMTRTILENIKRKEISRPSFGLQRKRWSRQIPPESQQQVWSDIYRVLLKTDDEIKEILDAAEVDDERMDLITIGAGYFQFGDHK